MKEITLVTGASGYIGAQVADHLLKAGYALKFRSCRSTKAAELRRKCDSPDFEIAVVEDLIAGDFSNALKGISSIVHVASPLVNGSDHVNVAVNGTLNLLKQAHAMKVYKVVIVGSFGSMFTTVEETCDE
ncbi:hypothetical protein M422DRAFT_785365, partial [Sphaerobolus stellatus SS14]